MILFLKQISTIVDEKETRDRVAFVMGIIGGIIGIISTAVVVISNMLSAHDAADEAAIECYKLAASSEDTSRPLGIPGRRLSK